MGWDKHFGYQLYQSDPSGNYGGWKATCIGNNNQTAISILKQEYKIGETKLADALKLATKILSKTLDTTKLSPEKSNFRNLISKTSYLIFYLIKVEIATLTRENNKTKIRILSEKETGELIKHYEEEQAKVEAERLAKEKANQQLK